MSKAREFVDDTPAHLTANKGTAVESEFSTADLGDREFWCRDCQARVTQTSDRSGEYGHHPTCEHSIRTRDEHALLWRGSTEGAEECK